jgi:hydroxymethylbilane synthase
MATVAERALLNQLGGGCQVPIGAFAEVTDGVVKMTAICARPDGTELLREIGTGKDPVELGQRLGNLILGRGGDKILKDVYAQNAPTPQS